MKKKNVKRSIYYYDVKFYVASEDENNSVKTEKDGKKLIEFFREIEKLQNDKSKRKNIITTTAAGEEEFFIVDSIEDNIVKYKIVLCRENALPYVEEDGDLENLEKYITKKKNIAEITHCVFFAENSVIGAEFNFSGARASAIIEYYSKIARNIFKNDDQYNLISVKPIVDLDACSKLEEGKEFYLFEFSAKINSKIFVNMFKDKSLFTGIVASCPDVDTFDIVLKKRKRKNQNGFKSPVTVAELKELTKEYRDDIKKLYVSQGTYNDKIDLLADKMVSKISLVKTKERTIDTNKMFEEIILFYNSTVNKK